MQIFEGTNINEINTILWKNKGTSEPPSVISSTKDIVRISYDSEKKFPFEEKLDSFRLEWIVDGCGGVLKQHKGIFTSPDYPRSSPVNSTCEWNIITEYGFTIVIAIENFTFESSSSCSSSFLSVRFGTNYTRYLRF